MNECKEDTEVHSLLSRPVQERTKKKVGRVSEQARTNKMKLGSERGWLCWLLLLLWKQHDRADQLCSGNDTCASS